MVEDDLRRGEAYLLANQMRRNRGDSRKVEAELKTTHNETRAVTLATAAIGQLTTASTVAQLTDIVTKLMAALTPTPTEDTARRPSRLLGRPPREQANSSWDCGNP